MHLGKYTVRYIGVFKYTPPNAFDLPARFPFTSSNCIHFKSSKYTILIESLKF